jgi:hypothetical protein
VRDLYATAFARLRVIVRFVFAPQGPRDDRDIWW